MRTKEKQFKNSIIIMKYYCEYGKYLIKLCEEKTGKGWISSSRGLKKRMFRSILGVTERTASLEISYARWIKESTE